MFTKQTFNTNYKMQKQEVSESSQPQMLQYIPMVNHPSLHRRWPTPDSLHKKSSCYSSTFDSLVTTTIDTICMWPWFASSSQVPTVPHELPVKLFQNRVSNVFNQSSNSRTHPTPVANQQHHTYLA